MKIEINSDNVVICDFCNDDYTILDNVGGGFIGRGWAACPKCLDQFRKDKKLSKD